MNEINLYVKYSTERETRFDGHFNRNICNFTHMRKGCYNNIEKVSLAGYGDRDPYRDHT